MKKAIAMKWAEALESGQYNKCVGALRKVNKKTQKSSFCCLGVLCNLHAQTHPKTAALQKNPERYMGKGAQLPAAVRKWAGMNNSGGNFTTGFVSLISMNDEEKRSFKQIATEIRLRYEDL